MKNIFLYIHNKIAWILKAVKDDEKDGLSLSRSTYLVAFSLACFIWYAREEITEYHFAFILIQLGYILFKDKALKLITNVLDTLVTLRTGKVKEDKDAV